MSKNLSSTINLYHFLTISVLIIVHRTTQEGAVVISFNIYIEMWPGEIRCHTICSPESKASTLKFTRQRLAAIRRKGNPKVGRVVCEPIYDDAAR